VCYQTKYQMGEECYSQPSLSTLLWSKCSRLRPNCSGPLLNRKRSNSWHWFLLFMNSTYQYHLWDHQSMMMLCQTAGTGTGLKTSNLGSKSVCWPTRPDPCDFHNLHQSGKKTVATWIGLAQVHGAVVISTGNRGRCTNNNLWLDMISHSSC